MNARKIYILTILLCSFACVANSATNGCYVSTTGRMYYQTPNNDNTLFQGSGYYKSLAQCAAGAQFFGSLSTTNTNCWASYDGSGPVKNSNNYLIQGKKATFNVFYCPIDTYTILVMAIIAGVGFFFLRRMMVSQLLS